MKTDYIETLESDLEFYKEAQNLNKGFNGYYENPVLKAIQKRNISWNHKYYLGKIRYIKTQLNRLRRIRGKK